MAEPFLDIGAFETQFGRDLSDAETPVATRLLQVVSDWIRDNKPDALDDDPAAQLVTFEVTRDALRYGDFGPLISFSNTVGPRAKSGTFDRGSIEKFITDRHRRILGISVLAGPRGKFKRCDY
jgi:hypothetical protein